MDKSHHWRAFAPQFIAKDEVRYEDFELSEQLRQRGAHTVRARDSRPSGAEAGEETAEANEISLERRRKEMDRQRERWKKREAAREEELAQLWEQHLTDQRVKKEAARAKQRAVLAELAIASRKAKRRQELRMKRAMQSQDESVFLTSIDESEDEAARAAGLDKQEAAIAAYVADESRPANFNKAIVMAKDPTLEPYVGKIKVPPGLAKETLPKERYVPKKKAGLPEAARGKRKDNSTSGGKDSGEKARNRSEHRDAMRMQQDIEKAEQRVAEEEAREAEAANVTSDDADPEKSLMPNSNQLRRAQLKIMRSLASSMGAYRKQCGLQFARIVDLAEMTYEDKDRQRIAKNEGWSGVPKAGPISVIPHTP
jgi:hypothetical protein